MKKIRLSTLIAFTAFTSIFTTTFMTTLSAEPKASDPSYLLQGMLTQGTLPQGMLPPGTATPSGPPPGQLIILTYDIETDKQVEDSLLATHRSEQIDVPEIDGRYLVRSARRYSLDRNRIKERMYLEGLAKQDQAEMEKLARQAPELERLEKLNNKRLKSARLERQKREEERILRERSDFLGQRL